MAGSAVEVEGLKEFRKALKAADASYPKEIAKLHREIARLVQPRAVGAAKAVGGAAGHFASSIVAAGSQASARIVVAPKANAAIFGASKRLGWNAGWRNGVLTERADNGGRPQSRPWVGSSWEPGGAGGPYGVNPAIRASLGDIDRLAGDGMEDLYRKAFPS